MSATIIVMLIWWGGPQGGGASIQNFNSLESCEAAKPEVRRVWETGPFPRMTMDCVEVRR